MELEVIDYLGVAIGAVALMLLVTPQVVRLAWRRQLLDRPGGHKGQDSPVPFLGGLVMVASFAGALVLLPSIKRGAWVPGELLLVLGLGLGLAVVGLLDDLWGLSRVVRLVVEVGAASVIYVNDVRVNMFGPPVLDFIVTVLWVVGIVNAFNLLDNMDGLSAGVAAIAAISFFVIAFLNGQELVAALSLAVAGCAVGFLRHNFHPATIYMGDAGALFLGFVIAVIGMKLRFEGPNQVTFFVPIMVLGVAIFDTALVIVTRLLHRRNPFLGGRDHMSHRLVFIGIPVPIAVGLIYLAAASLGYLAVVMSRVDRTTGFMLMGMVLVLGVLAGFLFGAVPVYETSRRRRIMFREVARHEDPPPAGPYIQKPA